MDIFEKLTIDQRVAALSVENQVRYRTMTQGLWMSSLSDDEVEKELDKVLTQIEKG